MGICETETGDRERQRARPHPIQRRLEPQADEDRYVGGLCTVKSSGWLALPLLLAACAGPAEPRVETQLVERVVTEQVRVEVLAEPFHTPHPILSDARVRKAIAYCTNRPELIATVYSFVQDPGSLMMDTFIQPEHWAHASGVEQYPFHPDLGRDLLEQAGWMLAEGAEFRTNAEGGELALHFATTDSPFRLLWAPVFESNMVDCGIRIVRLHSPASWFFGETTGLSRRDFELAAFAWQGEPDPGGASLYSCEQIPLPSNGWEGQNYVGWCNERASTAIKLANHALHRDEAVRQYAVVQQEFAADMVSLPLFARPLVYAYDRGLTGFVADPGELIYTWDIANWEIPGQDRIVLAFSAEPASLDPVAETSFVSVLLQAMIFGRPYTTLGYDYQPRAQADFATLESGGARLEEVKVQSGDRVVDANGAVVELGLGDQIRTRDDEVVVFEGGRVGVPRLAVPYRFVDGLSWSDGVPVSAGDFALFYRLACEAVLAADAAMECARVESITFQDDGYMVVWLPGMLRPDYYLAPFGYLPSHIRGEGGQLLADVPAGQWAGLRESIRPPVAAGPYVLTDWVNGRGMTFRANPHYYGGEPRTPEIEIRFVERGLTGEQLTSGAVDFAGWDTLGEPPAGDVAAPLLDAFGAGQIQFVVVPSPTWEHVDMNLFVP